MERDAADAGGTTQSVWRGAFAGLAALFVGIGLARFAYTPLTPALIGEGWFSPAQAVYLGATNLAGYFVGALGAHWLALRVATPTAIRAAMVGAVLSFLACAWPAGFLWFFPWRLVSGISGGALMVLATSSVLVHTPANLRGRVSGTVFCGVGFGITAAGTLVPALARAGLSIAWLGLAAVTAVLTLATWWSWPADVVRPASAPHAKLGLRAALAPVARLIFVYASDAIGFMPHALFWIDYIARGLGHGLAEGGWYWVAFGLGAASGPPLTGFLGDRIGVGRSLALALLAKAMLVALPLLCQTPLCLMISSLAVGALTPGMPVLVAARAIELTPRERQRQSWAWMTITYAIAQIVAAYGLSFLFAQTGSYNLLFAIGAGSLSFGAGLAWLIRNQRSH